MSSPGRPRPGFFRSSLKYSVLFAVARTGVSTPHGLRYLALPRSRNRFPGLFIGSPAAFSFPLVPKLLAFGERQFDLHAAIFEVHSRRNKRLPFLLRLPDQFPNFVFMHQQFPGSQRCVIENVPVLIGSYMAVEQPELTAFHQSV